MTQQERPLRFTIRWRLIVAVVVGVVKVLRWRVDVQGLDNVPRRGGAVLAFNHHSYADFVMVAWGPVLRLKRPVRFLAKREIWANRWVGWAVRWVGAVPVDRSSTQARAGAFDAAATALRAGDLVIVAPEQTISRSFELLPLRTGAARMAQLAGVPIVPAIGWGTHRFATKGTKPRWMPKIPVTIRFGDPVDIGPDDDPVAVTDVLSERMSALLHEVQESYPGGAPEGAPWVPARLGGGAPSHDDVLRDHESRTRRWEGGHPPDADRSDGDDDTGSPASG